MMTTQDDCRLPQLVLEELRRANVHLQFLASSEQIWNRLFTSDQRQELGGDYWAIYERPGGMVAAWMQLNDMSQYRAIIELAHQLDLMPESMYRWLQREIDTIEPPQQLVLAVEEDCDAANAVVTTDEQDVDARIHDAVQDHSLVLVIGNGKHVLFWNGLLVSAKGGWGKHRLKWELLLTAARAALDGRCFRWDMLTNGTGNATVVDRKNRIKIVIPSDLHALFRQIDGEDHRLELPAKSQSSNSSRGNGSTRSSGT